MRWRARLYVNIYTEGARENLQSIPLNIKKKKKTKVPLTTTEGAGETWVIDIVKIKTSFKSPKGNLCCTKNNQRLKHSQSDLQPGQPILQNLWHLFWRSSMWIMSMVMKSRNPIFESFHNHLLHVIFELSKFIQIYYIHQIAMKKVNQRQSGFL